LRSETPRNPHLPSWAHALQALDSLYNSEMNRDTRTFLLVAVVVLGAVAAVVVPWWVHEHTRPRLVEARVVLATDADPVFREGPRHVASDERVHLAVAVRLEQPGRASRWLTPADRLELDGRDTSHETSDRWPEKDRFVRVYWFTVEASTLGGDLTAADAAQRLRYRTFLAPELGRGLSATGEPVAHNGDAFGAREGTLPVAAGTLRVYARVEVVDDPFAVKVDQDATTLPVESLDDPRFPAVLRSAPRVPGVDPSVGELFLLPGFEPKPADGEGWNDVTAAAFQATFVELVKRRLVTSSWTFAAVAASGAADLDRTSLTSLGRLEIENGSPRLRGRSLAWSRDVEPGDLLAADDGHLVVLVADDGNGTLDAADTVWHCWRLPAAAEPLGAAFGSAVTTVEHLRHGR